LPAASPRRKGGAPIARDTSRGFLSRLRRFFDTRADDRDGLTGTCRLCGERRHDLDDGQLCRPCAMAVW
jgi:hypothetical protein